MCSTLIRIKRASFEQTSPACPSQWEGETAEGEDLYVRYRYGNLRVDIGGETAFSDSVGDGLDGTISWEEVVSHVMEHGLILLAMDDE